MICLAREIFVACHIYSYVEFITHYVSVVRRNISYNAKLLSCCVKFIHISLKLTPAEINNFMIISGITYSEFVFIVSKLSGQDLHFFA